MSIQQTIIAHFNELRTKGYDQVFHLVICGSGPEIERLYSILDDGKKWPDGLEVLYVTSSHSNLMTLRDVSIIHFLAPLYIQQDVITVALRILGPSAEALNLTARDLIDLK